ncbi:CHASE3 domain-containing protein [Pedobacter duraquae]|uniref:CHASE3 domain sensor protein n=1 Tax=Pedobacter duraquae TaxID=425511 RepID=A0A4R6IDY8_9SPHI|nr:CHASE3 domain-containing protein [Pedobacter duraquae]TDO20174.1 CHASE3 domain sensor protein [Pedobacter duraquae]
MTKKYIRNIRLSFGISILILLISSIASYFSITKLLESEKWVSHTFQVIDKLDFIVSRMKDAETGQRGFLLTGDKVFLEPYTGSQNEVAAALEAVSGLTIDNSVQQQDIPVLEQMIDQKYTLIKKTIVDKERGIPVTEPILLQGKEIMDGIRVQVIKMEVAENQLLLRRQKELKKFITYTPIFVAIGAILSLLITGFFYNRIQRNLDENSKLEQDLNVKNQTTQKEIEEITKMAKKISEGNYSARIDNSDS